LIDVCSLPEDKFLSDEHENCVGQPDREPNPSPPVTHQPVVLSLWLKARPCLRILLFAETFL